MAVSLFFSGTNRAQVNDSHGRYQASVAGMTLQQADELKQGSQELEVGVGAPLETRQVDDYRLSFRYMDEAARSMDKHPAVQGRLPQAANEVALQTEYLAHVGSHAQVGGSIPLTINGVQTSYTITGLWTGGNEVRSYTVLVSQALLAEQAESPLYTVFLRVAGSDGWGANDITGALLDAAASHGIAEDDLDFSDLYFALHDSFSIMGVVTSLVVAIIIALACSLVIYSLFYVSVVGKTQEYGLLRIIGTTQKQVERIVKREAMVLSALSLPIGAVLGALVGYLLIPDGWHWPTTLCTGVFACIILYGVIMSAARKPVKLAAKVTPVEAMRHTSYADDAKDKDTKKLYRSLNPRTLARINMGRNKKKTVLTILSLGVCGILLMISASYLNSINVEDMAGLSFPRGELVVELGENGVYLGAAEEFATEQRNNTFTKTVLQAIADVDGVEEITPYRGVMCDIAMPTGAESKFLLNGYSRADGERMGSDLLWGTCSYDALMAGHGVVITDMSAWSLFGWEPALGDTLAVKTLAGDTVELTVMGIRKDTGTGSNNSDLFVPEELLAGLQPGIENPIYQVAVKSQQGKADEVEASVRELLANNPGVHIRSMKDQVAFLESSMDQMKGPIYLIVIFIGIFGLLNLVNTLMTNVVVCKKELSVLQTLGLTGKQLRRMILVEGLYYVLGTMLLTLSAGTLCGYLFCRVFDTIGIMGTIIYRFPTMYVAIYLAAVVLVQVVFSSVSLNTLKKESLVERIREG